MVSPSMSPVVETVAVKVSVELTGSGDNTIVGAGGGVLIRRLSEAESVKPVLSVAVTVIS